MNLYLVRHGETDWNTQGLVTGQSDISLNDTGIAQAKIARDEILARKLQFDTVYVSPLQRTRQTAEIITNGRYHLTLDDRLKERDAGEFSGQPFKKLFNYPIDYLDPVLNSGAHGVEPIRDFDARARSFLQSLQQNHPDNASILIITSNGFMKRFISILTSADPKSLPNFQNCKVHQYTF